MNLSLPISFRNMYFRWMQTITIFHEGCLWLVKKLYCHFWNTWRIFASKYCFWICTSRLERNSSDSALFAKSEWFTTALPVTARTYYDPGAVLPCSNYFRTARYCLNPASSCIGPAKNCFRICTSTVAVRAILRIPNFLQSMCGLPKSCQVLPRTALVLPDSALVLGTVSSTLVLPSTVSQFMYLLLQ